ncbi:uroporphyrinogen decarboxylase [Humidisolicoccus flavus]|uniref:uroporphyrinogen decarboxylase n=1 Tax=Humidisolicoccus flavus TaxID=3111414 RepID=UPI00324A58FE
MSSTTPSHLTLPSDHPLSTFAAQSALIRAYRGERAATPPVWFMRQAGRSLPEYRELRVGTQMLDACLDPALASEITLQPVRRHGVDAGIFFSDIMIPLRLAGVGVEIEPGVGPVIDSPVNTPEAVERLIETDPAVLDTTLDPIREGVALTVAGLADLGPTPLIGFAGAPFTLAAYLVGGRPSKDHMQARRLMLAHPESWAKLMEWCADVTGRFLRAQIESGASAAQLFDSWAGSLPKSLYLEHVRPASAKALEHVRDLRTVEGDSVPLVHFAVGAGELYDVMNLDVDAIGVDWRTPIDEAYARMGSNVTVQGNIDPAYLGAPWEILRAQIDDIIARASVARAHVLNLGHGVPPETDPTVLTRIVEYVHGGE